MQACLRLQHPFVLSPCRVWSVRFNHFHDQLVLTSSSDSRVTLSRVASVSSEPFGHLVDEEEEGGDENRERYVTG